MSISDSITRMEVLMAILERLKEEAKKEEEEEKKTERKGSIEFFPSDYCSFECAFHILKADTDTFGEDGEVLGLQNDLMDKDEILIYTEDEEGVITLMTGTMNEEGISKESLKIWKPTQDELFARWKVIYKA